MTLENDASSWEDLSDRTSDAEWNEFWRGYPYTHNVRAICREFVEQAEQARRTVEQIAHTGGLAALLAAELARLEEGEAEMQELLDSAPLAAAQAAGAGEPAGMPPLVAQASAARQGADDDPAGAARAGAVPGPVGGVSRPAERGAGVVPEPAGGAVLPTAKVTAVRDGFIYLMVEKP